MRQLRLREAAVAELVPAVEEEEAVVVVAVVAAAGVAV